MMGGFGGMGFGWFVWLALIVAGVFLVRGRYGRGHLSSGDSPSALDILKKRYAKGEIGKDEFDRTKKDLI